MEHPTKRKINVQCVRARARKVTVEVVELMHFEQLTDLKIRNNPSGKIRNEAMVATSITVLLLLIIVTLIKMFS